MHLQGETDLTERLQLGVLGLFKPQIRERLGTIRNEGELSSLQRKVHTRQPALRPSAAPPLVQGRGTSEGVKRRCSGGGGRFIN